MKIKELIEKLKEFPEDMELLVNGEHFYSENLIFYKDEISYCKYSTHWNSNAIHYGYKDADNYKYQDFVDGKTVSIEIPMKKKEVVMLYIS
jgi:hypothetical protein